jgi:hypothetical protein
VTAEREPEPQRHPGYLIRRAQQAHAAARLAELSADISNVQNCALAAIVRTTRYPKRDWPNMPDLTDPVAARCGLPRFEIAPQRASTRVWLQWVAAGRDKTWPERLPTRSF